MGFDHRIPDLEYVTTGGNSNLKISGEYSASMAGAGAVQANCKQFFQKVGFKSYLAVCVDLTGFAASTTLGDAISAAGNTTDPCYVGQVPAAFGRVHKATLYCQELPVDAVTDIDFEISSDADKVGDADIGTNRTAYANGAVLVAGQAHDIQPNLATQGEVQDTSGERYIYLAVGVAGTPGTYTAGKIVILLEGICEEVISAIPDA